MTAYKRHMRQDATYWPPADNDGFGGVSYGPPVSFSTQPIDNWWDYFYSAGQEAGVRWQNKSELFRDSQAREVMSSAIVYAPLQLEIGGKIALGLHVDEQPVADSIEIRQVGDSPNLRDTRRLYKAWL